ncbi:MAG: malate:quinone oxidoreductase, partial [Puniceicoccaceae bacterium]|nr:malate:quinone oxidoreductase [Puniceicoccaceae bacterium]
MKSENQILDPDIILIGSGIMSATLGAMLKELNPALRIQLYEMTEEFGKEASNA